MATSLMSLFENPMPEKQTLIESLSWNQIPKKPIDPASLTEIFGELHFHDKPESPSDPTPRFDVSEFDRKKACNNRDNPSLESLLGAPNDRYKSNNTGFSPKNSESLQLCTEGLGSESSDDVEDLTSEAGSDDWRIDHTKEKDDWKSNGYSRRSGVGRSFPPPIPSIGGSGKPWVCFKSYRDGRRFVLREIRIPTQEFLRASREDGRLKLHFIHPEIDMAEGEEEEEYEEEEGGGSNIEEKGQVIEGQE